MVKIDIKFVESIPEGRAGYWIQNVKKNNICIYVLRKPSTTQRRGVKIIEDEILTIVHELTEALSTNMITSKKFNTSHHKIAIGTEKIIKGLFQERDRNRRHRRKRKMKE